MSQENIIKELVGLQDIIVNKAEQNEKEMQIYLELKRKDHICPCCSSSTDKIHDYREQITINNEYISKKDFADYTEKYCDNDCTEFELLTAIMYKYFADKKVDYAVIECGMGGLDDSTNAEKKNISVITSVSIDHTAFLGNTLEEIARQKSGIIRNDCPCVLYPNPKCEKVFLSKAPNLIKVSEQGSFEKNNQRYA